jgi:hypothetical protein
MKISNFKKFHKNRSIYENNIMEPVEDTSEVEGFEYPQAQMNTTTKPDAPTKPLVQPVPPGTKNPNQQPTVTPVKAQSQAQMGTETKPIIPTKPETVPPPGTQNPQTPPSTMPGIKAQAQGRNPQAQAQGRYSQAQAQPSRGAQSSSISDSKVDNLDTLATKFDIKHDGSNAFYVGDFRIEQYSENSHFAVFKGNSDVAIDTKTTDADKAKIFIDKLVADTKAQSSQMAQEPKMIGERRSNKKSNKSRINELNDNQKTINQLYAVPGTYPEVTDRAKADIIQILNDIRINCDLLKSNISQKNLALPKYLQDLKPLQELLVYLVGVSNQAK